MKLLNASFLLILAASVLAPTDASPDQKESPPSNASPQSSKPNPALAKDAAKTPESARVPNGGPTIEAKTTNKSDDAKQTPFPLPLPVRVVKEPPESDDAKSRADHTSKNEDLDLQAQQSMASSAESQLEATYIVIAVSFLGTVFLIWTVVETRKTANAATIAAEAASRQAKAAVNVERPFVYVSDIELIRVPHPKMDQEPFEAYYIVVTYTNYGRTPAIALRFGHGHVLGENLPPEPVYWFVDIPAPGLVIKPGESHPFQPLQLFIIKPEDRKAITQIGSSVFPCVWGQIRYRDFFNGITEIGFSAFQTPERRVGEKILDTACFRPYGPPAYTYQRYRYSEGDSAPEAG